MVISVKLRPLPVATTLCILFCLVTLVDVHAYPSRPEHPGENASPEELSKYTRDHLLYIQKISSWRFGKRSTLESVMTEIGFDNGD